jgi:2-methylcitrate dehydratase PrpD
MHGDAHMTLERALAEWAAAFRGTSSELARAVVRDAFVDIVACIIGGSVEASSRAVVDATRGGGRGDALALGTSLRLPAPWAALVSGTAAHALDFDDNFAPAAAHATAVLAPALFALADENESSGADLVRAYIVGLELQARIGNLVNPGHYEKGWHATSTVGILGAAAACASLLRLDAQRILAAMSIAFSMASGSKKQFGSMVKPIHAGLAAKNAVLAARMAQAGITGDVEPLSGPWGFMELYGGGCDPQLSAAWALDGLGDKFAIETEGLLVKRHPCCGAAHRTLDGLVELRARYQLTLDMVDHVEAFVPEFARANLRFDDPCDAMQARFSLTYCAVRVLQNGELTLDDLTPARVRDPIVRTWLPRVLVHTKAGSVSEELGRDATPAITRIVLNSGLTHEVGIRWPKGSLQAPLSAEEQRGKFADCCRWAARAPQADRLFDLARSIHSVARFSQFSHPFAEVFGEGPIYSRDPSGVA